MDEQTNEEIIPEEEIKPEIIYVCKCVCPELSSEMVTISEHKKRILGIVTKTENYLRERRIPQLIRFLLSKLLAEESDKPFLYLEKLIDDCMLFRAGIGVAPVLFEERHLEAVLKSFDPGQRGWLAPGQIRRLYTTLGLPINDNLSESMSCETILNNLRETQENELFDLISSGTSK